MMERVLIVEERPGLGDSARGLLERQGFNVEVSLPSEGVVAAAYELRPDLILLVLSGGAPEAIRWAGTVSWIHASPVLVLAKTPSDELVHEVSKLPYVADILRKPVPVPWLLSAVEKALASRAFMASIV